MNIKTTYVIPGLIAMAVTVISCAKELLQPQNNITFNTRLSDYHLFKGVQADLVPADGFMEYTLPTALFTDYAEKQRLIKIPAGTRLLYNGDGLPVFPDGTILAKTFYYFNDANNLFLGKRITETRLLIFNVGKWNVATYIWNVSQTDATLEESGTVLPVSWKNDAGKTMNIHYRVPNMRECATCHNSNDEVVPIGFKLRNLNTSVIKNGTPVNQLYLMMQAGLLDPFDPSTIIGMVNWQDNNKPLDKRARAYLDINCAHCHNPTGFASSEKLNLDYAIPLEHTRIAKRKESISKKMEAGEMPKLGITIVDEKALLLIKEYLKTL